MLQPSSGEVTPPLVCQSTPVAPRFVSNIYCSQKCQETDKGSTGLTPEGLAHAILGINTAYSDAILVPDAVNKSSPLAPPSPLLGSDTDTSSAASTSIAAAMLVPEASLSVSPMAASAPKTIDSFRLMRDAPDAGWRDLSRQRRSSIAAGNCRMAPLEPVVATPAQIVMSRQKSGGVHHAGSVGQLASGPRSPAGASSDSLASLWNNEYELAVHRTPSSGGAMRAMTPMNPEGLAARRSMSSSSDGSGIQIASRGLQRDTYSHTSLGGLASPGPGTFAEVGSAPNQHDYLRRYANAFPARDACVSPSLKPVSGIQTPDSRSSSVAIANARSSVTIRARPRTASGTATWDAFGKAEVRERSERSERTRRNLAGSHTDLATSLPRVSPTTPEMEHTQFRGRHAIDSTPKQSLEVENGGWCIRYAPNSSSSRSRSRSASREATVPESPETRATSLALPIPVRARPATTVIASSSSTARSRTPQSRVTTMPARRAASSMTVLPDLAALRVGSPCAPVMSPEYASPTSRSIPRAGFDWEGSGSHHRTYALPPGVVTNPNKGLFYFKA